MRSALSGSGRASTWMLRIRNSCLASASSTWCPTSVCVAVLFGAKTKSWTRHPHSGRICRSPSAVPMMMRTDSSMLASYRPSRMAPFGPTEQGNLKPTPKKLLIETPGCARRLCSRDRHFHHPLAVGTGHDRSTLPFLDLESVGSVALGADEPAGAARVDGLDDLVPDRFERGQAIFGVLIPFRQSPLVRHTGASQPGLNPEETCSREADPYLARWGAIKPPPGSGRERLSVSAPASTGFVECPAAPAVPPMAPSRQRRRERAARRSEPPPPASRRQARSTFPGCCAPAPSRRACHCASVCGLSLSSPRRAWPGPRAAQPRSPPAS